MLVELKNGETLNGHLVTCDNWMNLILREVVQTSPEGDKFFRLPEVYIRGNNVRTLDAPAQDYVRRANHPTRSNTSESPKRSLKSLRSSKQTNHRADAVAIETAGVTEAAAVVVVDVVGAGVGVVLAAAAAVYE